MEQEIEIWKKIDGFEYEVSSLGRVKALQRYVARGPGSPGMFSLRKEKLVTFSNDKDGYKIFGISKDGKEYRHRLHRLVAEYFKDNPNNHPEVNHIIPDKSDNRASNLEWCSPQENKAHAKSLGLVNVNFSKKFNSDQVKDIRDEYAQGGVSISSIARKYKVDIRTVRSVIKGRHYKEV